MILKSNKQETLNILKAGDVKSLELFYQKHKNSFLKYLRKRYPNYDESDYLNIYHDSIIILINQVKEGREISCTIKTYLYSIGLNRLRTHYQKSNKLVEKPLSDLLEDYSDLEEIDAQTKEKLLSILRKAINLLKSPAKEVIQDYLDGKSPEEIMHKYGYKNLEYLYHQKHRYKKRLKKIAFKIYNEEYKKYE